MKRISFFLVLSAFFLGSLKIASAAETELWAAKSPPATRAEAEMMETYYYATKLCKPLSSRTYEGPRDALRTKSTAMAHYFWNGLIDFTGNPFLATEETRSFLRNPGYGWAMKECFGNSIHLQNAFYVTILAMDRAGYLTNWVITGKLMSTVVHAFAVSRFALAHPKVAYLALGALKVSRVVTYAVQGAQMANMMYQDRQQRKRMDDLMKDTERIGEEELDSSLQIVRDRIAELETEIAATNDPEEKEKLEAKKAILDQIILESEHDLSASN